MGPRGSKVPVPHRPYSTMFFRSANTIAAHNSPRIRIEYGYTSFGPHELSSPKNLHLYSLNLEKLSWITKGPTHPTVGALSELLDVPSKIKKLLIAQKGGQIIAPCIIWHTLRPVQVNYEFFNFHYATPRSYASFFVPN